VRTLTLPQNYDATDMTFDSRGRLYVASQGGFSLGRFAATGGAITPFGTNRFNLPFGLAFDRAGNLFIADSFNGRITTVAPDGTASTFMSGLSSPWGIAFDASGNLYSATEASVKKIAPDGTVSTFATGFSFASGLAFGVSGDLYVADQGNNSVTRVTPDGTVHAFATGLRQPLFIAVEPDASAPGLTMPVQTPDEINQSGARLFLTGGINHYYQVLYSTDLAAWTPFQTNQIVAGSTLEVVDSGAANGPQRFYRARLLP
jgi:sugar lactone lactonase YvrE